MPFFVFLRYNEPMDILYGKLVSNSILADLKEKIIQKKITPGLAVILIGKDRASKIYVGLKEKRAREIGMNFFLYEFTKEASQDEIIAKIREMNLDQSINGIIVQLPLPKKFDTQRIINEIAPWKDVDGFHPSNIERFKQKADVLCPVFPKAIIALLISAGKDVIDKKAVVIANSKKFGEVMVIALERKKIKAQYFLVDVLLNNIEEIKKADIIVTAVGDPGIVSGDIIKEGAIVIDGGIAEKDGKIFGDIDFKSVKKTSGHITPVPGGVGPVTIACLLENVFFAYEDQNK